MKVNYSSSKMRIVAALALSLGIIAELPLETHARNTGSNSFAQRTYQYAYFCAPNGNHDSTEVFANASNSRFRCLALNLTTPANGNSIPNTALVDPRTPTFSSTEFDAKGNNANTVATVTVSLANGFLDVQEVVPGASVATPPTRYTPTGYTHYKLVNTFGTGSIFLDSAVVQFPGTSSATLSLANFALNTTGGLPNVIMITSPAVPVCQYANAD